MSCEDLSLNPGDGLFKLVVALTLIATAFLACTSGILCQVVPRLYENSGIDYAKPGDFFAHVGLMSVIVVAVSAFTLDFLLLFFHNRKLATIASLLVFMFAAWFLGSVTLKFLRYFVLATMSCGGVM